MFEAADSGLDGGCDTTLLKRWTQSPTFSMTDVSLNQIDSTCSVSQTCGGTDSNEQSQWYSGIAPVCRQRESNVERFPTISASSPHNLCTARLPPNPTVCRHPQGMLHGLQGQAWNNLYEYWKVQTFLAEEGIGETVGIFENPMAAGKSFSSAKYGFMRSRVDEIAGHYMSYIVDRNGVLKVEKVPLRGNSQASMGDVFNIFETSNGEWLSNLAGNLAIDISRMQHMRYDSTKSRNTHWTCPLREVLLWSGNSNIKPWIPNPQRTGRMYSRLLTPFATSSSNMLAHPTTNATEIPSSMLHTSYWTSNGFCVYLSAAATTTSSSVSSSSSEACSLYQLARSVWDQGWRNFTTVFESQCMQQVDWPYHAAYYGRDGTFATSSAPATNCAVLDRLSVFQYRIRTDAPIIFKSNSQQRTVSKKGVCHMGRTSTLPAPIVEPNQCWKIDDLPSAYVMRCKHVDQGRTNVTWPKKSIKTPYEMVANGMRRRQKCNQCSAPPKFVTQRKETDGDRRQMPAPEVGYGRPFQWETARMLAGDLRFFLCGNASTCPHIGNASEWALSTFLQNYFASPGKLFRNTSIIHRRENESSRGLFGMLEDAVASNEMPMQDYETQLWESIPWVICTNNGSNCSGTISKQAWLDDRVGQCKSRTYDFLGSNPESLTMNIDLCNINGQMDSLCKDLLDSVLRITNLNCILAGKDTCLDKSYFYTPSVFSSSNQQFVRDTVRQFYQRFETEKQFCAADSRTQQLIQQNTKLIGKCAAVPLQGLKEGLEGARSAVDVFMQVSMDMLMITMDLMQLLVTTAGRAQEITQDLFYWFQQLIIDAAESLKQVGNVLYKALIENSPLGGKFREIVQALCQFVEWILTFVWSKFLCYIMKVLVPVAAYTLIALLEIVGIIVDIINIIVNAFGQTLPNASIIDDTVKVVKDVNDFVLNNLQCGQTYNFNCYPNTTASVMSASLPVATRCWAGYQPDAADASILSCTRADTCWNDATQKQILCDACPLQDGEDFLQFACSALTKRCTCGVQRYERTRCTTHEQCYAGVVDATCMQIADPLSMNAYSTAPCKQCASASQPVCIITSPSQPGEPFFVLLKTFV